MTDTLVLFTFVVAYIVTGIALLAALGGVTMKPRMQAVPIRIDSRRGNRSKQ